MSDVSLVFNLLAKDNISRALGVVKGAFKSAGQTAEESMRKATTSTERLDRQIEQTERHLAELNAEFAATGDKTLFGKMSRDRSLLNQLRRVRAEVEQNNRSVEDGDRSASRFGSTMARLGGFLGSAASALGEVGGVLGPMTSNLWGAVAALGAVIGALTAIGPAAALAGGALGSLPALIGGGAAAVGTLKLGLFGLSEEYQRLTTRTGGGGGGGGATKAARDFTAANRAVADAVRAVSRAERDVRDAQADALDAQRAINQARETASDRLRDQALDLEGARLDEADATAEVARAQRELLELQAKGAPADQQDEARRSLEHAVLGLKQAKVRTEELTEANVKNARTGVEGSDEVVQAKKRESDARRRVADSIEAEKDAERRLAEARQDLAKQQAKADAGGGGGGGGGAGKQITQLAPAARAFLNTILGLRPAFTALRLDVQQRLFAGLAGRLQTLADKWLPQLKKSLGAFADTFNSIAKTLFSSLSKKSFIENMAIGVESVRKALGAIGRAVAGPLVDAFGRLAAAATPFVTKLGGLFAGLVRSFSAWIRKADESGRLTSFFEGAAATLGKVWRLGRNVGVILGKIIGIIYGQSKSAGDSALDSINSALDAISKWLDDPKSQKAIKDVVADFVDLGKAIGAVLGLVAQLKPLLGPEFVTIRSNIWAVTLVVRILTSTIGGVIAGIKWIARSGPRAWDGLTRGFAAAYNWIGRAAGNLVNWFARLPGYMRRATRGMWDGIKDAFRSAINWLIGRWNRLRFSLPAVTIPFFGTIGGYTLNTPDVPYLAKGGTVHRAGMAVVGERGPELVSLSRGAQVTPLTGGAQEVRLVVDVRGADSEMRRMIRKMVRADNLTAA